MSSQKRTGTRRQLMQAVLYEQALNNIIDHQTKNCTNTTNQSEYQKKFCHRTFTPTLDNKLLNYRDFTYPLNNSLPRTFYTQQVMERVLKINAPILNLNDPFKRINIITDDIRTTIKEMN